MKHRCKAQATGADAQLGKTKLIHDRLVNDRAGQNDIGSAGGQANDLFALLQGRSPQIFDMPLHPRATQTNRLDPSAVIAFHLAFEARENGRRSARADQAGLWVATTLFLPAATARQRGDRERPGVRGKGVSVIASAFCQLLDYRCFQSGLHLPVQKLPYPLTATSQFLQPGRIAMWQVFHQSHATERKTFAKMRVSALAQNKFGATSPAI